jgi:hypothetical protein
MRDLHISLEEVRIQIIVLCVNLYDGDVMGQLNT